MSVQLLFCIEADNKSQTDWVYIQSVIDAFFKVSTSVSIKKIGMGGKGNFRRPKVIRQIREKTNAYKRNGETIVIYCIDTDDLFTNPDREREFHEIEEYCWETGAELIWFCRDIEEVFWGERISSSDKVAYAARFRRQNMITEVEEEKLCAGSCAKKSSCIVVVLEKYLERKKI